MEFFLFLVLVAFICEYCDSTFGGGYGTIMTPVLMLLGFHHEFGNTDLRPGSKDFKTAVALVSCSIFGSILAVSLAVKIPSIYLKVWIGSIVSSMGLIVLICRNKHFSFSWKRIIGLGSLAAFNKGLSGGGYGPLVTSGQILSGIKGKHAVGITSLSEGVTCVFGLMTYIIYKGTLNWKLIVPLLIGSLISVPFSAWTVKKVKLSDLTLGIGILTLVLGLTTLIKLLV